MSCLMKVGGEFMDCLKFEGFKQVTACPYASKRLQVLIYAIRRKDIRIFEHSEKVSVLACKLALLAGCSNSMAAKIRTAALFHDVGKLAVDATILFKEGPLTKEERIAIEKHPRSGYELIRPIIGYRRVASIILEHHERYDGSGYPKGIKGENIHIGARIIAICDAYDAMRSNRPYARPMTQEESLHELKRHKGTQFDARLVDLFVDMIQQGKTISR
jgi:putative nucleotidyltransferase with HDIG domain